MLPFKKIVGPDYKEGYKRNIHSKFLSTDPEVKKRFGVFKVTELLKNEDKQHFKNLYNYDISIVEQYKLPEEKKEKEAKENKKKDKERKLREKRLKEREHAEKSDHNVSGSKLNVIKNVEDLEDIAGVKMKNQGLNFDHVSYSPNFENEDAEDVYNRNLKEIFSKIFDPNLQKEEMKELEEELYVKKDSKTSKRLDSVDNGEKAVQFFAMYGNTTPIKFIFCKKKEHGDPYTFRPYDLEVIKADKAKDDYFIITPTGITHVYNSNLKEVSKNKMPSDKYPDKVAEFYTLSDWMYQSTLFNILKRVNYYKKYLPFKIFTIWRNFNRFKKYVNIRNHLGNKLFVTKPAFVDKLINCNGQIYSLEKVELHRLVRDTPWSSKGLIDFDEEQRKVYDRAKLDFKDVIENKLFLTLKNLYRSIANRLKETRDIDETENSKTLQELKNKSMFRLKIEKQMRAKLIKKAVADVEIFDRFITLIDLMFVEKTYALTKKNMKDMKIELYRERKDLNNSGVFTLTLGFAEGAVTLVPSDKDLEDKFKTLFRVLIEQITDVPRFISTCAKKDYDQIFLGDQQNKEGGLYHENERGLVKVSDTLDEKLKRNFKELIERSKYFKKFSDAIYVRLYSEYKSSLVEIKRNLEPFIALELEKESWSVYDFLNSKPEIDAVKKRLEELKLWGAKVEDLRPSIPWGIMNNFLQPLKEEFIAYIKSSKETLEKEYIRKLYIETKNEIDRDIKEGNAIFTTRKLYPIGNACAFKTALNNLQERLVNFQAKVNKLNNLYTIIKQYNIDSVAASDLSDYEALKSAYKDMDDNIKSGEEEINKAKETLLAGLYEEISSNKTRIKDLSTEITSGIFLQVDTEREVIERELHRVENEMNNLVKEGNKNNSFLKTLNANKIEEEDLDKLKKNFEVRNRLWMSLINLEKDNYEWRRLYLSQMRTEKIEDKIKEYKAIGMELTQTLSETVADKVLDFFNDQVSQMESCCPVVVALSSSSMQDRHWREIFKLINLPYMPESLNNISLGELLDKHSIIAYIEQIDTISAAAIAQEKIQKDLEKIEKDWANTKFVVQPQNSKSRDKYIICALDDIFNLLDEHSQLVASALSSRHVAEIRDRVTKWDEDLNLISRVIEEWLMVQKQWIYLENIFSAEDIKKQLPEASKNFNKVNKGFKDLMFKTYTNPIVIDRCRQEGLLDQLVRFNKELDSIQKSLEDYLQTKRKAFPRFYFLSNDELLKILSQTRNPRAVQDYLNKCFDGIKTISFISEASNEIIEMISPENEVVKLYKTLFAHENIEAWLNDLEEIMFSTVYEETKACLENYPDISKPRKEWIYFGYPCQSVITIDQVMWAHFIEQKFLEMDRNPDSIKEFSKYMEHQIFELAELVTEKAPEIKKSLVERLIIINVHARDVVRDLVKEDVREKNNFEWQKNLKFYWEYERGNDGSSDAKERYEVVIRQTNSRFIYGYEYLGNPERMVITPLTDKCYITLTSALHLNYGGAPAGPAGTGKTETTKDLSKALAIKVNVFNCTDQLDFRMMGRMFCGLAECGAWACFDEFNRIDIEVLSVIAQQIESIQSALKSKTWDIYFDGKMIKLKPRFGVFITMNPGYAGRTELPDNLKSLFRPVAMMIPDYALVSEVTLYSKGFKEAKDLSIKMYQLFKLSSEQLSKQKHYDFGLRGIKSILSRAGYLKLTRPNDPEKEVLIRAMKDSNLPKFLDADIELFLDIIKDLFPYTTVEKSDDFIFQNKVREVLEKDNLQCLDKFLEKVTQLLDTMMVRLGNMLVGQTGTGKSSIYMTLVKTLTELGKNKEIASNNNWFCPILTNILNPKSVTKFDLYMSKDEITQTWEDGIVAKLMRSAEEEEKDMVGSAYKRRWIVFDGPVDALWIEDMNTVLDDSRKLCLPDSSNIRIPKMMNLIFEVQDLRVASPATVSRCGMVYIEPHHVGYIPIIETWCLNYKQKMSKIFDEDGAKKNMKERVDQYLKNIDKLTNDLKNLIPKFLIHIRNECKEKIPSSDVNLVNSCLNLITCFFNPEVINPNAANVEELCNYYMAFSLIWSLGANIDDGSRASFAKLAREVFLKMSINFDMNDIYDVFVNENGVFSRWAEKKETYKYDRSTPFFNILVPTTDTVKYKYLMKHFNANNYPSLFMGETGVGKSVIIIDYLNNCEASEYIFKSSNFSAKTTSKNVFDTLKSTIYKNGNFQPPTGKKFIYFIDDINLPQLDEYGSQQPIEFLRQLIDNKTFYDEKKTLKKIKDVIFMACCAPPSGGRNKVTPRLFRHFNMVWMTDLSVDSMKQIFKSIMEGFLESSKSLYDEVDELMDAALDLYNKIRTVKLPTPSKSHYTFNLRDLSKVVQGMLQSNINDLVDKKMLVNLWIHETSRQFRDRLLGEDIEWFDKEIADLYENRFKLEKNEMTHIDRLIFTTVIDKNYKMVFDFEILSKRINEALDMYNVTSKSGSMNLVFFTDAINHFCKICRILSQDRGNALLVGLGGSGRQSLTRLVGFMLKYEINYLQVGKGYGVEAFWKDIGKILIKTGCSVDKNVKKNQIFLFSDTQIIYESFLEDINNILNNGEVPNLFKDDEIGLIFNTLKDSAKNEGYTETKDSVYQYFVSNVRDQLHIVLCFSPVGEGFRNRCRQFPSIINCCTIDWFNIWPDEALKSVADRYLTTIGSGGGGVGSLTPLEAPLMASLANVFVKIQTKALELSTKFYNELRRSYYITPTSYLEFIKLFIDIYQEKIAIIPKQIQNYRLGIEKLEEANIIVKKLKEELVELEPQQVQKKGEVQDLIQDLEEKTKLVEVERGKLKVDFDVVDNKRNEILKVKEECDFELSKAKPELEKAKAALSGLDEADIRTLRSYPNPSENIVNLAKTICYIFDQKTEYAAFKVVVNDGKGFIASCQDEEAMIKKLNDPRKLRELARLYGIIDPVNYNSVNFAAVGLKIWVGALLKYIETYRIVKPKMESLEKAKKELTTVEAELEEKSKVLREKEAELGKLQKSFNEANKQLEDLTNSIHNISVKSHRAKRLVEGLKEEGQRWKENIVSLEKEEKNLLANVILSAAVVSYSGPFTTEYRKEFLISSISYIIEQNINYSTGDDFNPGNQTKEPEFNLQNMLSDPMQIREWIAAGLPADDLSIENAIITIRSKRWPLIVDPQMQANRWIKNFYRNAGIKSYKISDRNLFNRLKDCIMSGYPCLVENVEQSLDSSLEPILQKQLFKQGAVYYLAMGSEKPIQYMSTFKLFMTSKLANPHYLPEISIKVTLINFTVTQKGLEDQLLVDVVKHERPDLEAQKDALVLSINENKRAIKDLESVILNMVKDASTEILENDILVNNLAKSKVQSVAIKEDLEKAETTSKKINKERRGYRPIAVRGSILYFVISSLANIDSMYNYSLEYFSKLFNQRLQKSEKNPNVDRRVEILIEDITYNFYEKISRGLFEKDKLLYSFLIFINIALNESKISQSEWNFFLRGSLTLHEVDENSKYYTSAINTFIDLENYKKLLSLKDLSVMFYDIENQLVKNSESAEEMLLWKEFFTSDTPYLCKLPDNIEKSLNDFYRLILIKLIREEKIIFAIKNYIGQKKFLESPPFNIGAAFEDSLKSTPLIFILSPGANPVNFLRQFAIEKGIKMTNISLGQGQGEIAKSAILRSKDTGDWVCLENCHLARSWMPKLEEILEDLSDNESSINMNFRLWLTSMPSDRFPVSILQSGVKITNEPPKGIKANLKGTFQNLKEDDITSPTKPYEAGKLIFSLAFFHAIILERRKFGPLGWNIPYEWMNSDFDASKLHVKMYIEAHKEVPFKILQYLVGVINYGGRVTDDKDGKLISAILFKYFNELIFDDYYKFSESGIYYAPKTNSLEIINNYLDTLPLDDEPEVFGLHSNANITLQNKLVREFMEPLISIQPRSSSSGALKPDDEVLEMKNTISQLFKSENVVLLDLKKYNSKSVLVEGSKDKKSPLGNFLLQEGDKFNNLISIINSSLKNLELAVKGLIVMSPDIEKIYHSFLNKSVPKMFEDNAYLSLKPLASWAADLAQRMQFMSKWLYEGPPKSFWLSAFFFPQGFNTAVLQTYARKTNIPIDILTFKTNILRNDKKDENIAIPEDGLNIHGLFLQGGSWNWSDIRLKEPAPGELWHEMPCIW
jgi:dynein heavy chain, axonemal